MHDVSTLLSIDGMGMLAATTVPREEDNPLADPNRTDIDVLVVDDDAADYVAMERLFAQLKGYKVKATRASSALKARRSLATKRYDVAMVDYRLGPETGVDVIRSLIRRKSGAAPILITGYSSPDVQQAALHAGAVHCVSKNGLNAELLETTIRCALHATFWGNVHAPARIGPRFTFVQ